MLTSMRLDLPKGHWRLAAVVAETEKGPCGVRKAWPAHTRRVQRGTLHQLRVDSWFVGGAGEVEEGYIPEESYSSGSQQQQWVLD